MKQTSTLFLQGAIVILAIAAIAILIRIPQTEGRAENLDLFHIYADPFILYGYASSITFFVALFKAFQLLGYIRKDEAFTAQSVAAVKTIKKCAVVLGILIVLAGIYIRIFHHEDDDPAGFLALSMATTFASFVVAAAAFIVEEILRNGAAIKAENEELKK